MPHQDEDCPKRKRKHKKQKKDEPQDNAEKKKSKKKSKLSKCYKTLKARLMAELDFGDAEKFIGKVREVAEKEPKKKKKGKSKKKNTDREGGYYQLCGDHCPPLVTIFPPFCRTKTTGSVVVPDIATEWYKNELDRRNGVGIRKEVTYLSPIRTSCYPLGERKSMKAPVRIVPRETFNENSFIKVSNEFLALLKRHEDWLLNRYPEYGLPPAYIKTKGPMTIFEGYRMPPSSRPPVDPDCTCGPIMDMDDFAVKKDSTMCYPHTGGKSDF